MRARAWLAMAVLGLVGVLMLGVFPARALMAQRAERRQVAGRIHELDAANRNLEDRRGSLNTDAEIERLAREQYNLVRPNEVVFDIVTPAPPALAAPPVPTTDAGAGPEQLRERDDGWVSRLLTSLTDVF